LPFAARICLIRRAKRGKLQTFIASIEAGREIAMTTVIVVSPHSESLKHRVLFRRLQRACILCSAAVLAATFQARAQEAKPAPEARIVVVGDGDISVAPDYARISAGVTSRAKTAREAAEANSKAMADLIAALTGTGIDQKDIQTSRFSVQPVYNSTNSELKLTGFSASNQVSVTIRQIDKVSDVLDKVITAGATDVGSVEFLHSDTAKVLDRAREAAMADARRKAEVYAHAAGLTLGGVAWVTEDSAQVPMPKVAMARASTLPAPPPIAAGEDTLHVHITVGYDIAR
jgi:uncharacterized protein YggE